MREIRSPPDAGTWAGKCTQHARTGHRAFVPLQASSASTVDPRRTVYIPVYYSRTGPLRRRGRARGALPNWPCAQICAAGPPALDPRPRTVRTVPAARRGGPRGGAFAVWRRFCPFVDFLRRAPTAGANRHLDTKERVYLSLN